MKGFYDKILPNVAKKVSKKLGGDGKVGDTAIKDAGDQMSIEITDAMRDKVGLGVPLMARANSKEIAEAFKKKGYPKEAAQEYMERAGVDEAVIRHLLLRRRKNRKVRSARNTPP